MPSGTPTAIDTVPVPWRSVVQNLAQSSGLIGRKERWLGHPCVPQRHTQRSQVHPGGQGADLASQGVKRDLLSAQCFGETQPMALNDTPEGRAKNRRVNITLTGDGT